MILWFGLRHWLAPFAPGVRASAYALEHSSDLTPLADVSVGRFLARPQQDGAINIGRSQLGVERRRAGQCGPGTGERGSGVDPGGYPLARDESRRPALLASRSACVVLFRSPGHDASDLK